MHQGSALSPLLFVIVMEAISREFRVALPWELLYADDLVVTAETEEDLIKRLNDHHHTPQLFYGPFSGTTWVSRCQKRTSGLYGARED